MNNMFRDNKNHILDLLERRDFREMFNNILKTSGVTFSESDIYEPKGYDDPGEMELREFGPKYLADQIDWSIIREW